MRPPNCAAARPTLTPTHSAPAVAASPTKRLVRRP